MKIEGTSKEITALVLKIQGRLDSIEQSALNISNCNANNLVRQYYS